MKGDVHEYEYVWQYDKRTGKEFLRKMDKQKYRMQFRHILIVIIALVGPVLCGSLLEIWRMTP